MNESVLWSSVSPRCVWSCVFICSLMSKWNNLIVDFPTDCMYFLTLYINTIYVLDYNTAKVMYVGDCLQVLTPVTPFW